jgi:predicted RNA methylase
VTGLAAGVQSDYTKGQEIQRHRPLDIVMPSLVTVDIAKIMPSSSTLPLLEDRVIELVESIDRLGLLQPLVVVRHEEGCRLIAGRHRLEAVKRLMWKAVPCVVLELDHIMQQLAEVDENLVRRSLTYLDRAELIARRVELLNALGHQQRGRPRKSATVAGFSTTMAGRTSCLSPRSIRLACQIVNGLTQEVRDQIRATKAAESNQQLVALTRLPADEQREVARLLASGVHRRVGAASVEARRLLLDHDDQGDDNDIALHVCDYRDLQIQPQSARLLLTDPPWGRDWLDHWTDLAAWAAKFLAPGGVFASYAGIQYLPQVMQAVSQHLSYTWTLACQHTGESRLIRHNKVMNGWQPILLFTNGPPVALEMSDFLPRVGKEKTHHAWQQSVSEAEFLIERLTRAGDLVVDGCMGSGTVAVACQRLQRRFIGGDSDPVAVRSARKRLREDRQDMARR